MARGSKCPGCQQLTFFDQGSYDECSKCGYIGWSWKKGVANVGKGKGNMCPNCSNQTLHKVKELPTGLSIRRCGICDFSAIEPAPRTT
jgi:Zn ribbon nucleic-acid-binding protein